MATQMNRLLTLGAVLALTVTPACYTLFRHPKVRQGTVYDSVENTRCLECHEQKEFAYFHRPANHAVPKGDRRDDVLSLPWWYESRWHYDSWRPANSLLLPPAQLPTGSLAGLPHNTAVRAQTLTSSAARPLPPAGDDRADVQTRNSSDANKGRLNDESSKKRTATRGENKNAAQNR